MPNRIIRESINESEGLSGCSPFAQDFFKRLITYADDFGRFNADLRIMRARLYPLEYEAITDLEIEAAVIDLISCNKISFYRQVFNGNPTNHVYGYLCGWSKHQRQRDSKSKFPDPESGHEWNDWAYQRSVSVDLKRFIFERDKFTCQQCKKNFRLQHLTTVQAVRALSSVLHIDHAVPVLQGGRATEENLRLLCVSCNLSRSKIIGLDVIRRLAATCGYFPQTAAYPVSESENRESNPKARSVSESGPAVLRFEDFWTTYPDRNGKKLEKVETRTRFLTLSETDQALAVQAARHYGQSEQVRAGIGIRDPKRFLRDGKGQEPWRDWIEPEKVMAPMKIVPVICTWPTKGKLCGLPGHPLCPKHVEEKQRIQHQQQTAMGTP